MKLLTRLIVPLSLLLGVVLSAGASADGAAAVKENGYALVYTIQVAAYEVPADGERFANQNSTIPLQCRLKDNGLFAVYYGVFEDAADARTHLQDYPLQADSGAYVVRLENVSLSACGALVEQIQLRRNSAYGIDGCASASGCDIQSLTRDILPPLQQ